LPADSLVKTKTVNQKNAKGGNHKKKGGLQKKKQKGKEEEEKKHAESPWGQKKRTENYTQDGSHQKSNENARGAGASTDDSTRNKRKREMETIASTHFTNKDRELLPGRKKGTIRVTGRGKTIS